jgi:transposase
MGQLFAGLDVADKTTAICVVDGKGKTIWEGSAATDPSALSFALKPYKATLKTIGLEAGTKAAWLQRGLSAKRFPTVCLETRHTHAALSARPSKSDEGDANGIALMLSRGMYTTAHVKSAEAMHIRMLLIVRRTLLSKSLDLHITLRMTLKQFGIKLVRKEDRSLVYSDGARRPNGAVRELSEPMMRAYADLVREYSAVDRLVRAKAKSDPVCCRLMTIPGVGPITALSFRAAVDDPMRFRSSRDVAAYFGLTPRRFQSGETDVMGSITKCGDRSVRTTLFQAAHAMMNARRTQAPVRLWALELAKRKCRNLAAVALSRKLCVLMHRMWLTERDFDPIRPGPLPPDAVIRRA